MNVNKLLHTVRARAKIALAKKDDSLSRKMNQKKKDAKRREKGDLKERSFFGLGRGFVPYLLLVLAAVLFSQALNSSLSAVLLAFTIIWPVLNIIYLLIVYASVDANIEHSDMSVIKNQPTSFRIQIVNNSLFPVPFAEADFRLPADNAVRCKAKRIRIAAAPNSDYAINSKVTFAYRGTYDIGVDCIYVYDFFKLFRLKVRLYSYRSIYVMPRRFAMSASLDRACSDVSTEVKQTVLGADKNDVSDIRTYQPGDPMKSIHWKLSSKSEELQVKQYNMNSGKTVYLMCDLAAHFTPETDKTLDEDINEYGADGVVELCLALADKIMLEGNVCVPVWYDSRGDGGVHLYPCSTEDELESVLRMLATAPVCDSEYSVGKLVPLISDTQAVTLVFVTACPDADFLGDAILSASLVGGTGSAVEVYYFNPLAKVNDLKKRDERQRYFSRCKHVLASHNIKVTETTAEDSSRL